MAQIQISINNKVGGSSSATGEVTDPVILAAARTIMDALTDAAEAAEEAAQ